MDSIIGSRRSPGEGNGNPLQYSCLENSMNREAWWATVHEVTKSQTQSSMNTCFGVLSFKDVRWQNDNLQIQSKMCPLIICKQSKLEINNVKYSVVLEKTLESPLDCNEMQPVHPKGDQSWVFNWKD